jgi:hypothetical protein
MARKYKRKDLSKMTLTQRREYKKILAYGRAYYRERKEWKQAVKNGTTQFKTLKTYLAAKHGDFPAAVMRKRMEDAPLELERLKAGEVTYDNADLIGTIERLLVGLKNAETQKKIVVQEMKRICNENSA